LFFTFQLVALTLFTFGGVVLEGHPVALGLLKCRPVTLCLGTILHRTLGFDARERFVFEPSLFVADRLLSLLALLILTPPTISLLTQVLLSTFARLTLCITTFASLDLLALKHLSAFALLASCLSQFIDPLLLLLSLPLDLDPFCVQTSHLGPGRCGAIGFPSYDCFCFGSRLLLGHARSVLPRSESFRSESVRLSALNLHPCRFGLCRGVSVGFSTRGGLLLSNQLLSFDAFGFEPATFSLNLLVGRAGQLSTLIGNSSHFLALNCQPSALGLKARLRGAARLFQLGDRLSLDGLGPCCHLTCTFSFDRPRTHDGLFGAPGAGEFGVELQ
jgi:hypothetical protein